MEKSTQDQPLSSKVLAYVHWFTNPPKQPHSDLQYFPVDHLERGGKHLGSVIKLESIVQPCPLVPRFPANAKDIGENIDGDNCLQLVKKFWINSFHDHSTYQTIF